MSKLEKSPLKNTEEMRLIIELEGLLNKSYLTEWKKPFKRFESEISKNPELYTTVSAKLLTDDSTEQDLIVTLPKKLSLLAKEVVARYISTLIHNTMWLKGSYGVYFNTDDLSLFSLVKNKLQQEYINMELPGSIKSILSSYFGTTNYPFVSNEAELRVFKNQYLDFKAGLPPEPIISFQTGNILVINLGVSITKLAVINHGSKAKPIFVSEPRSIASRLPQDNMSDVTILVEQIRSEALLTLAQANISLKDIDGIVLGNSNFSPRGQLGAAFVG